MIQKFFIRDEVTNTITLDLPTGLSPRQMLVLANDHFEEKHALDECSLIKKSFSQIGDVYVMTAQTPDGGCNVQVVWSHDPHAAAEWLNRTVRSVTANGI